MAIDVTARAESNADALRAQAAGAIDEPVIDAFHTATESCVAGTAVRGFKLEIFDSLERLGSAREVAEHHPDRDPAEPVEDFFRRTQGAWYQRRTDFEDHWKHGRAFMYFALLLGGPAPPSYGDVTLIADPALTNPRALACFPANTAQAYAGPNGLSDIRCEDACSPWHLRAEMLVVKHAQAVDRDQGTWPDLICSDDDFSETVIAGQIDVSALVAVRVRAEGVVRWRELRRRILNGEPLQGQERAAHRTWETITRWRDTYGTPIVEF